MSTLTELQAPPSQDPQMKGEPGVVQFTLSVTRATTGQTEHFAVTGTPLPLPCEDSDNGCDPHDGGT